MDPETMNIENLILNIINSQEVTEQTELQAILKENALDIPQATLSRKLKKLNIAKVAGTYRQVSQNQVFIPEILSLQVTDFGLILLHTHPAQAGSLAYFFDQKYIKNNSSQLSSSIIGTIAGDDTVLLICKSKEDLEKAQNLIYADFSYLRR
ncbi:MAG: ArgR family transcriptional regulator [Pseudomonadota bacterium]